MPDPEYSRIDMPEAHRSEWPIAAAPLPPVSDPAELERLRARRRIVLALNLATMAALSLGMIWLLSFGGFIWVEWAMLAAFLVTLPWLSIGVWNAILGLVLDLRHGARAAEAVTPALARIRGDEAIRSRIAIVMAVRNEDPKEALTRFRRIQTGLAATPWAAHFDFHVLSDTDIPAVVAEERAFAERWAKAEPDATIRYRLRTDNSGYKAGNIADFLEHHHREYAFFLPLDADSTMDAPTILRMVRVMEASPEIGILQSLVTGMPSRTFFTRAFQFGMRHGMRSYTLGSAWWQGDCGPCWGHNVLIRAEPFHRHCKLPVLPGNGPLSGHILSHDQVEAVLMRRAGYEVRVMAEETGSHEENPPSLVDFIRRDLRWCNGNMQYFNLLRIPGLKPLSRLQLFLAIQMYASAIGWMTFILLGALLAAQPAQFEGVPLTLGLGFFAVIMTLNLLPKIMGLAQVAARPEHVAAYGGYRRLLFGGVAEIAFSMLIAPIVSFAATRFMIGLAFGRRNGWPAQQRSRERLYWREAIPVLWPQTVTGLILLAWLGALAPWSLWFAGPVLLAFIFAIPLAVWSTLPPAGAWSRRTGLFDIPEDRTGPAPDGEPAALESIA